MSAVTVGFPANLGLATSGLGTASCAPQTLEALGAGACPADSRMGAGNALVEVPFGPALVSERVTLALFAAPSNDGYLHIAILAAGSEPVAAQIVLTGIVLPGRLQITVPAIPTLPGAPYASLASIHATLGGALTYYERVRGRNIAYRPRGIGLPDSCPRGGWRMSATLAFLDGQHSQAGTAIPCPRRRR